jgi:uncharacterized membrane protein YfcA
MALELSLQNFALLVGLGFAVGAYGTLIGAGGGFLLVPVLLLLLPEVSPASLTAMSLVVVFFNAYAGSWAYARSGRIHYPLGLLFATAGIPGALLGAWVVHLIPRNFFEAGFGGLLVLLGTYLLLQPERGQGSGAPLPFATELSWKRRLFLAAVGSAYLGLLSTLLGIGGGILYVPFMIRILGLPLHTAIATSQFVLALTALAAALTHLLHGALDSLLGPTAFLALGVMMGAPVGAALSSVLRGPLIVRLLALALIAVAGRLLWRALA